MRETERAKLTLLVVEQNQLFREGLARLLESRGYSVEPATGEFTEAVTGVADRVSGALIAIADAGALAADAGDRLATARAVAPGLKVVVFADADQPEDAVTCFQAGVDGCVLRDVSADVMAGCIDLIAAGERMFPSRLIERLVNGLCPNGGPSFSDHGDTEAVGPVDAQLSRREREILASLAQGRSNKQIAEQHDLTEATTKVHLRNILRKIRASNRTQAAVWAITHHISAREAAD